MAQSQRQKLIKDIELSLGGGIVDIELDADHYNLSIDHALDRYRQRSSNSTEEFTDTGATARKADTST